MIFRRNPRPKLPHGTTLDRAIGGMAYVNWWFDQPLHSVEHVVDIDTPTTQADKLYLQLFDAPIDGTGQYFGLQTGMFIFSAFGLTDPDDIRANAATHAEPHHDGEGKYLSLRLPHHRLEVGQYRTRLTRAEEERNGDWFELHIATPSTPEQLIGAIRFPRSRNEHPATFRDVGGTWLECFKNTGGGRSQPVTRFGANVSITGNAGLAIPKRVTTTYSAEPDGVSYPFSNIEVQDGSSARIDAGDGVQRINR